MLWTPTWQVNRDLKARSLTLPLTVTDHSIEQRKALDLGRKLYDDYGADISPDLERAILAATASTITSQIAQREPGWTATHVVLVYVRQATRAHERCNVLTEVLFNEAVKAALDLDAHFDKTGELVGPLHGVPVSIKDQVDIAGHDSTMGLSHAINRPASADATLIRIIREAGGIPFVKTNVPQTMLSFESSNPLFGRSSNPYDPQRITGGSSGGEGGLLGSDGSVIGIGSDIGGSLRIPAHFSGCYSIKPCAGRIASTGCRTFNAGFTAINSSMGAMARSVSDVETMMRVQLDAAPSLTATEDILPIPYRNVDLGLEDKKLRFGFFAQDKFCRTSPACERAVRETVDALRREGHECVEFEPPSAIEAMECFVALTSAGRYEMLLSHLQGDPQESSLWLATVGPSLPWFVRSALAWLVDNVVGDIQFGRLLRASKGRSVKEMQEWQHKRDEYVDATRKLLWSHHGFDAVLCPPQATPALKHGETWNLSPLAIATIQWNVVDSTVGLVPVTRVDPQLDALDEAFRHRLEREPGSSLVEKRVYGPGGVYDAHDMADLPVGVQVVGRRFDEERVIELMKVVDHALGPRGFAPGDFAAREREREKVY
ncbi:hypothetical protein JCM8208_006561 [Rhodotorula glutinis]